MKTFPRTLALTAMLALASLPRRAEGEPDPQKAAQNLQNLLSKHNGDAIALAATLLGENANYRDRIRTLEGEVEKTKLPDGSVVLSKADAERYAAYQALGKPDELKTKLADGETATSELGTLKKRDTLRTVADKVGYKPSVLERLGGDLTFEEIEVDGEKAGEKVKTYGVKLADKVVPLDQYAKEQWGDFLPALAAQGGGNNQVQQRQNPITTPIVPLGGNGGLTSGARTPEQIAAEKRASGDYSM
ncbi:hypothetical protein [Deinococcus hopiensis]|uniref:Uncharacterized protein n=1 Tax=Deinococcus hopiensis KR-140 TaxID=695939 RepID=A0A1W1VIW4_9DEIO|nr:hypothetical protein [Deinococcus hopiensis]SMB93325.1 hypothetical protein SAMN00790413_01936 [Deinococcus hopiensis KR-140]